MRHRQKPIPPHVQPPVASLRVLLRPRHDLTVPTVTFRTLYVFVVLSLDRRRITHLNVTTHPNVKRDNGHEGEQVCCRGA
jgi:hypothetical protein